MWRTKHIVVKSHNYGRDFVALTKLLPLGLRYVGLIGPRKRHDQLTNELLELDVMLNAGFFAPAGLDLAAETPQEIALSIVSEIQRVFAKGTGESLCERKVAIHSSSSRAEATNLTIKPIGNSAGSRVFISERQHRRRHSRRFGIDCASPMNSLPQS